MSKKHRFNGHYKNSVVVFLDLMGIRNFTLRKEESELFEIYSIIERFIHFIPGVALDTTKDPLSPFDSKVDVKTVFQEKLIVTSLSDSIIISLCKKYLILLPFVIRLVAIMQLFLLTKGLPVRGGIASGKIFHKRNDPITFGEGLVEAANLERIAQFPRVLIDESLLQTYENLYRFPAHMKRTLSFFQKQYPLMLGFDHYFKMLHLIMKDSVEQDYDGKKVACFLDKGNFGTYGQLTGIDFIKQFNMLRLEIKSNHVDNNNILEKWSYLENLLQAKTLL